MTDTIDGGDDSQCLVHMSNFDADCEVCQNEVAVLHHQMTNGSQANRTIERRLAQLGMAVTATNLLSIRLNTLIESACMGNPKTKARFELSFQQNVANALSEAEQQAVRAQLMHGVRRG